MGHIQRNKKILEKKQKLDLANFTKKFLKNLSTYNIPDPELIIRTSGEERIVLICGSCLL